MPFLPPSFPKRVFSYLKSVMVFYRSFPVDGITLHLAQSRIGQLSLWLV